jgi:hypothetical protein
LSEPAAAAIEAAEDRQRLLGFPLSAPPSAGESADKRRMAAQVRLEDEERLDSDDASWRRRCASRGAGDRYAGWRRPAVAAVPRPRHLVRSADFDETRPQIAKFADSRRTGDPPSSSAAPPSPDAAT